VSSTQRRLTPDDVAGHVRSALGADASVRACSPLAGGGFAAVWRVDLADGRTVVLKVGPAPGVRLLRRRPTHPSHPTSLIEGLFALVDLHSRE